MTNRASSEVNLSHRAAAMVLEVWGSVCGAGQSTLHICSRDVRKNINQSEVCPYVELFQVPAQLVHLCDGRTAKPVWKLLGLVSWGH